MAAILVVVAVGPAVFVGRALADVPLPGKATLYAFLAQEHRWSPSLRSRVRSIAESGKRTEEFEFDESRDLAKQCGVRSAPGFVLAYKGRVCDRYVGVPTRSRLAGMYEFARLNHKNLATLVKKGPIRTIDRVSPEILRATVRITVDSEPSSTGSGTIVRVGDGDALVVTCGHLFDHWEVGDGIGVTVFDQRGSVRYEARRLAHDARSDVGLVLAKGIREAAVVPLADPSYRPRVGDQVVVSGCDYGSRPSGSVTEIAAFDRFLGPGDIAVDAIPVHGRSGGGLISKEGKLIGVCNGINHVNREGVYASLKSVRELLGKVDK